MKKLIAIMLVAILVGLSTSTASAISNPDFLVIQNANSYRSMAEDGDLLVTFEYFIQYTSNPTEAANEAFLAKLDYQSSQVATAEPFPYFDSGYGFGLMAFYLSADEVTAASITLPLSAGDLEIRLQGDPGVFAVPPATTTTSVNRSVFAIRKAFLATQLIGTGTEIFTRHGVQVLEGNIFNDTGTTYMVNVVPNVVEIVPDVFSGAIISPEFAEFDNTHNQTARTNRSGPVLLAGTSLDNGLQAMATEWQVDVSWFYGAFWMSLMAAIAWAMLRYVPNMTLDFVGAWFVFAQPIGGYFGYVDLLFGVVVVVIIAFLAVWKVFLSKGA